MRYSRPGAGFFDTEVLDRPTISPEQAKAIAEAQPGIELIPNLTPSPPVKEHTAEAPVSAQALEPKAVKRSRKG